MCCNQTKPPSNIAILTESMFTNRTYRLTAQPPPKERLKKNVLEKRLLLVLLPLCSCNNGCYLFFNATNNIFLPAVPSLSYTKCLSAVSGVCICHPPKIRLTVLYANWAQSTIDKNNGVCRRRRAVGPVHLIQFKLTVLFFLFILHRALNTDAYYENIV